MSTITETATAIRPFHIDIPDSALQDLRRRIAATRWPSRELATCVVEKGKPSLVVVE